MTVPSMVEPVYNVAGSYAQVRGGYGLKSKFYQLKENYAINSGSAVSGAVTVSFSNGGVQSLLLGGNITLSFTPPPNNAPGRLVLILTQNATGGYSITWPTITWVGSGAPSPPTTPGTKIILTVLYDGGVYLASVAVANTSPHAVVRDGTDNYVKPYTNGWGLRLYGGTSGYAEFTPSTTGSRVDLVTNQLTVQGAGDTTNGLLTIVETTSPGASLGFKSNTGSGYNLRATIRGEQGISAANQAGNLVLSYRKSTAAGGGMVRGLLMDYTGKVGIGDTVEGAMASLLTLYQNDTALCPFTIRVPVSHAANYLEVDYNGAVWKIDSSKQIVSGAESNYFLRHGRAFSWTETGSYNGNLTFYGNYYTSALTFIATGGTSFQYGNVMVNSGSNNLGLGLDSFAASSQNTLALAAGTAPAAGNPGGAGGFQMWGQQVNLNDWCPHFRCGDGVIIKLKQQLKASYNNWAALSDVVNALVATGLFDQA